MNNEIWIYGDGACSGNPGPGGYGSILIFGSKVVELGGGEANTTNNRMEISAILEAFVFMLSNKSIYLDAKKIQIFTDSVYLIRGITQWIHGWKKRGWKNSENEDVSNQDLWIELDKVLKNIKADFSSDITWNFVKGHAGVEGNERCDQIAVAFSKNDYIELYSGESEFYTFDVSQIPQVRPLPDFKNKESAASNKTAWYLSYVNGKLQKHNTWKECEAVVKGRPAKFKKVTSEDEQAAVLRGWGLESSKLID